MKISTYLQFVKENPEAAMVWDLTERFPRGPKGTFRKEDYTQDYYGEVANFGELFTSKFGYSKSELTSFVSKFFNLNGAQISQIISSLKTTTPDVGKEPTNEYFLSKDPNATPKEWLVFSTNQISRRTKKLYERLQKLKKLSESLAGEADRIYYFDIHHRNEAGRYGWTTSKIAMPAPDETTARVQFELFFGEMVKIAQESAVLSSKQIDVKFHAGVSSPAEAMNLNFETVNNIRASIIRGQKQLDYLQESINKIKTEQMLSENLALYIESFNISMLPED